MAGEDADAMVVKLGEGEGGEAEGSEAVVELPAGGFPDEGVDFEMMIRVGGREGDGVFTLDEKYGDEALGAGAIADGVEEGAGARWGVGDGILAHGAGEVGVASDGGFVDIFQQGRSVAGGGWNKFAVGQDGGGEDGADDVGNAGAAGVEEGFGVLGIVGVDDGGWRERKAEALALSVEEPDLGDNGGTPDAGSDQQADEGDPTEGFSGARLYAAVLRDGGVFDGGDFGGHAWEYSTLCRGTAGLIFPRRMGPLPGPPRFDVAHRRPDYRERGKSRCGAMLGLCIVLDRCPFGATATRGFENRALLFRMAACVYI